MDRCEARLMQSIVYAACLYNIRSSAKITSRCRDKGGNNHNHPSFLGLEMSDEF